MTKKLLIKKERTTNVDGRKIVLTKFEKHLVDDSKDFSTQYGMLKKSEMKKASTKVGKEQFYIMEPTFLDYYKQIKRLAQIIGLKDIGPIIAYTGINRDSVVMDAGTGSAGLACFLAKICNKVISYDINSTHQEVAKKNIEYLNIKNIELKKGDVFKPATIKEKDVDVLILDVTEPWRAIKTAEKVLKTGGFLVSYSPSINQVQSFVKALSDKFLYEKSLEVIEREWTVKELILRPRMKEIAHTAFLSFARKIQK